MEQWSRKRLVKVVVRDIKEYEDATVSVFVHTRVFSKAGLCLGDVDLDAVGALRHRVLPEGRCALGSHEPPAGLLTVAVGKVERFFPRHQALLSHGLLWYSRWRLQRRQKRAVLF